MDEVTRHAVHVLVVMNDDGDRTDDPQAIGIFDDELDDLQETMKNLADTIVACTN